jgi:SNF2 family DNA or RNA helicase
MGDQKALLTICGHLFCQKCIPQPYHDLACPVCFKQLSHETIKLLNEEKEEDLQPVESSSKINKLICDILTAIQEDRTNKSVVFSQWTGMLKLVEMELKKLNIGYAVLDGSMSRKDRTAAMDSFAQQQRISVFLISIRAGGVGLNLTMATRIYILEPHWNPSIEQQAIDRVHRIGQTKPVVAIHYIVKDSIEEKMLKLQEYKKQLSKIALKAEMSAEDKKKDRLLNLKMLLE